MAKKKKKSEYRTIIQDSKDPGYTNRLLVGTAATGLVRVEWVQARYGQTIPCNWSMVTMMEYFNSFIPLRYQVADAQNLIVKQAVELDFQWLLLWEHDVCPVPKTLVRLNEYIRSEKVPIVSGLYYTRTRPSEPLVYRGRGTSYYSDWKLGDKVWVDGVPTGFLLVHMSIMREMWKESAEYQVKGQITRRIFDTPRKEWYDPESGAYNALTGTSDLEWSTRVMKGEFFAKAGWKKYQKKEWPFLVDTTLFCRHVSQDGSIFP